MRYLVAALLGALIITGLWGRYEVGRAEGWRDYAKRLEHASQEAQREQGAMRAQEQATYERQASDADAKYVAALDRVRAAVGDYVRVNRVQPSRASTPGGVDQAGTAGIHEAVPTDNVSAISDADLQRCADATAYAISARDWALTITEPQP